jgi:hypothetical protein
MNNDQHAGEDRFDARLRRAHAAAVDGISRDTRLQLQLRRGAASADTRPPRTALAWPLAAACAAGALAIGLQLRQPESPPMPAPLPSPGPVATVPPDDTALLEDAYIALDESPDLYLWLASEDAMLLTME